MPRMWKVAFSLKKPTCSVDFGALKLAAPNLSPAKIKFTVTMNGRDFNNLTYGGDQTDLVSDTPTMAYARRPLGSPAFPRKSHSIPVSRE